MEQLKPMKMNSETLPQQSAQTQKTIESAQSPLRDPNRRLNQAPEETNEDSLIVPEENANRNQRLEEIEEDLEAEQEMEQADYIFNPVLITRGVESNAFYLILSGKVEVTCGNESFMIVQSAFNYLSAEAMTRDDYVPDFSAKVIEQARILRIRRSDYRRAISSLAQQKTIVAGFQRSAINKQSPNRAFGPNIASNSAAQSQKVISFSN